VRSVGLLIPVVVLAAIAVAVAAARSDAAAPRSHALAEPSTLVLVVNPSKRVHEDAFANATFVVRKVARLRLGLYGIYEQVTAHDRPPFGESFVASSSPDPKDSRPALEDCSTYDTEYARKRCEARNRRKWDDWRDQLQADVAKWRKKTVRDIEAVAKRGRTNESPDGHWNLAGTLTEAANIFAATATPNRCLVLLGGLAVRQPPRLAARLDGATVFATGWTGTPRVQDAWRRALKAAGATIEFIPEAVTRDVLPSHVKACLDGDSSPS
jgi:hypothetical protein